MPCLVHVLLFCCYFVLRFRRWSIAEVLNMARRMNRTLVLPCVMEGELIQCSYSSPSGPGIQSQPGPAPQPHVFLVSARVPQKEQPLQFAVQMLAAEQ